MMARKPLLLRVYAGLTRVGEPGIRHYLSRRAARGKEDPARIEERYGVAGLLRPAGRLVWIHAASVGETLTILPVVREIIERGAKVLLTTVTGTSARLAAERLPAGAFHQYVPVDVPRFIERFLDHWKPDLAIFAEQELWPNMLARTSARNIPIVLANGRMSPRSFRNWVRAKGLASSLLSHFDLCLAQSHGDANRLAELGAPRVIAAGNLKIDAPAPPVDEQDLARLMRIVGGRPVWAAASTHQGEEATIIELHRAIKERMPGLMTILAPRHPQRGNEVAGIAARAGLNIARRSLGEWPNAATDIFLVDTIGELGLVYRVTNVVFMGGSLVPHGGQNPIEAARLNTGILHGPHVHNFAEVYDAIDHDGGGITVETPNALASEVYRLLKDQGAANLLARNAGAAVASIGGALGKTMAALDSYFIQMTIEER